MYQRHCLHGIVKSICRDNDTTSIIVSTEILLTILVLLVHDKPSYHRLKAICRVSSLMIVVMVTMKKEQNPLKAVPVELYTCHMFFEKSEKYH